MSTKTMKHVMALGAGGAFVAGAVAIATVSPSWAMPVLSHTAAVSTAASNPVTDVRYYRRGYYGHRYYRRGYYGRRYYWRLWLPLWGIRAYPYAYPYSYSYSYPFVGFGWGWGGW